MYRLKSNQILDDLKPIASVFDEFLNDGLNGIFHSAFIQTGPKINIIDEEDAFVIELSAPGRSKSDFQIKLENDNLIIKFENEGNQEQTGKNFTHREFSFESFTKSFHLTDEVDRTAIRANYKNGILHVILPKKSVSVSDQKGQTIDID